MNTLKWSVIVGIIGLTMLSIDTVAYSQNIERRIEILNGWRIKELQAQVELLQTIIKTQETEIQRLKKLCKKVGVETESMEKQPEGKDKIIELYQKYKNKYALLDGKYIFFPNFDVEYSSSRKGQHPEGYESYTEWINNLRKVWEYSEREWYPIWEKYREKRENENSLELPKWTVGEYGRVGRYGFYGLKIFQIISPDEMYIIYDTYHNPPSPPETKWARFKGWSTKKLIDGELWKGDIRCEENSDEYCGVDIAIVGTHQYTTIFGGIKTILDVVPLELFRKGITLEQFKEMLKTKGDLPDDLKKLRSDILRLEEINRD